MVLALFSKVWPIRNAIGRPNTVVTGFPFFDRKDDQGVRGSWLRFGTGTTAIVFIFLLGSSAVWTAGDFIMKVLKAAVRLGTRAVYFEETVSCTFRRCAGGGVV